MSNRKKSTPSTALSPTRLTRRGSQDRKVLQRVATDDTTAPKPTLSSDGSRRVFYAREFLPSCFSLSLLLSLSDLTPFSVTLHFIIHRGQTV